MDKVGLAKNSEWLDDYPLSDLIAITLKIPVSSLLQRRDFQQRIESGSGITQGELLYPVVMALDSVQLNSDVEIGGRDQFLNLQMCRKVMEVCGKEPEVIITTDILEGTDGSGNKMSKSQGNYVGLVQEPGEMFGRIMSIPDKLLGQYYKMLTEIEKQEWEQLEGLMQSGKVNPMEIKKLLAMDIVAALHDPETAKESRIRFEQQFSTRNYDAVADGMPVIDSGSDILTQLSEARQESRSAIRRLLQQGGVQFIDESGESIKPKSFEELETSMAPTTKFIKIGKTVMRISGEIPRG
jgi:tyrosyl-tRNA synthetase